MNRPLVVFLAMGALSLVPFALLMTTCFVRVAVVLSILRSATYASTQTTPSDASDIATDPHPSVGSAESPMAALSPKGRTESTGGGLAVVAVVVVQRVATLQERLDRGGGFGTEVDEAHAHARRAVEAV